MLLQETSLSPPVHYRHRRKPCFKATYITTLQCDCFGQRFRGYSTMLGQSSASVPLGLVYLKDTPLDPCVHYMHEHYSILLNRTQLRRVLTTG